MEFLLISPLRLGGEEDEDEDIEEEHVTKVRPPGVSAF